jgi:NAD(P)-dependent dehydrogenase (short-subunit alcohol dehydrogenase family)
LTSTDLPLSGRIAVVTGASRGIGRASALGLARAGAQVVATARTQGGLEELDDEIRQATGERATLVPMDLREPDGIDQLGGALHQRFGRIDVLVHAAAMLGALTPVSHLEPKQWDQIVAANLTAPYRLIRSFEPLLKSAPAGRAIFVTTGEGVYSRAFWGAYAATKSGMETLVRCWADEMEHTKVRAVIVNPGKMRTRMRAEAYPGEDPASLPDPSEIGPMMVELAAAEQAAAWVRVNFSDWKASSARATA